MEETQKGLRWAALIVPAIALLLAIVGLARAQAVESDVPETAVVPGDEGGAAAAASKHPGAHAAATASPLKFDLEAAQALVKVTRETPVFVEPANTSKIWEKTVPGKFVDVTGSTHYFLQVKLKNGRVGYIDPAAVELVKPTDKIFTLTSDAAVLDKPNKWAKKVSEVHKGHEVHVVGVALNYTRIRMKSGLEGFIPMTAME